MRTVYEALDAAKLFSLKDLSSENDWSARYLGPQKNLQYSQSWVLVNYLANTYGSTKGKEILLAMKQGQDQEQALKNVLGVSAARFEADFKQYLQKIRTDAPGHIGEAEAAIQKAESDGRTIGLGDARKLVQEAKDALVASDFERAISLSGQAKQIAMKATAPLTTVTCTVSTITSSTPTSTAAPTSEMTVTHALLGLVVVVVAVVAALAVSRRSGKGQTRNMRFAKIQARFQR
jgi:hypothetical protein